MVAMPHDNSSSNHQNPSHLNPSSRQRSPRRLMVLTTREQRDHHQKRSSHVKTDNPTDPHNLDARFVSHQMLQFDAALAEIEAGVKQSCWLWFVLPTAPHIVDGRERGSSMNQHFALRGDDAVKAYLQFERQGVNLRRNYLSITKAVQTQLEQGTTMLRLFGPLDVHKAISSFRLFQRIAAEMKDTELATLCQTVLDWVEVDTQKREMDRIRSSNQKKYRHIMTV